MKKILITLGIALSLVACGKISLKQNAVATLTASETVLEAAYDSERALCSPTSNQALPIIHCDGPGAQALGLTDAKHIAIARVFSKAFGSVQTAGVALKVWRAGDPAPASVAEYQKDIQDVLALVAGTIPASNSIVAKINDAVTKAAAVATLIGVK